MTVCVQGFNISQVEDIVKDVFSKQDKTRAVDIFQVIHTLKLAQKKNTFLVISYTKIIFIGKPIFFLGGGWGK